MNIILLFIWFLVIILALLNFYINNSLVDKFVAKNTPSNNPDNSGKCVYKDLKTVDLNSLTKCKIINNKQSYIYNFNGQNYIIHPDQTFYINVCQTFCLTGKTPTGNCKTQTYQEDFDKCEDLFKPFESCNSSSKPIVNVKNTDATTQYYYPLSPLNSLTSCSSS